LERTPVPPPPAVAPPPPPAAQEKVAEALAAKQAEEATAAAAAAAAEMALGLAAELERRALRSASSGGEATCFCSSRPPPISLRDYLARFTGFMGCSHECYVLSFAYIDRLLQRNPAVTVSPRSCHRMLACSLVLAAKFQDDTFYSNKFYAKIAGLSLQEMNKLERRMLELLDYRLVVDLEEFESYRRLLCDAAAAQPTDSQADAR